MLLLWSIVTIHTHNILIILYRCHESVGPGEIGTTLFHRRFAALSLNQEIQVSPFEPQLYICNMEIQLSFLRKTVTTNETFQMEELQKMFINLFKNQVFSENQTLFFEFHGIDVMAQIASLSALDISKMKSQDSPIPSKQGILIDNSTVIDSLKNINENLDCIYKNIRFFSSNWRW